MKRTLSTDRQNASHDRSSIDAWIRQNRFRFSDNGCWLIGREPNTQDPDYFEASALRVLIVRLSSYTYVSSSMSHGLLGQLTLEVNGTFVDYCFMPLPWEASLLNVAGIPPLFGITTKRPFSDFDIIAISNSVAQELVNLPWMLAHSGIPGSIEERCTTPGMPILVLGGANAQSAFIACGSKHGTGTSLVDALYFGEAEVLWKEILDFLIRAKAAPLSRLDTLAGLKKEFAALHVPLPCKETEKESTGPGIRDRCNAILSDVSNARSLVSGPVWYTEDTLGYSSIATDFGCPFLCKFCKEAWEKRPYRMRSLSTIIDDVRTAKQYMGLDTVNLFSFNFTSHSKAGEILESVREIVPNVQIKSQRFDVLLEKPDMYEYIRSIGKSSFTFGLEGISGRIRRFFRKNIGSSDVLKALDTIYKGAVRHVKIFLIASGFEDEEDLDEFSGLVKKMAEIREASNAKHSPLVLSVTPLIPMPHTPLQFVQFIDEKTYVSFMKRLALIAEKHSMIVRESVSLDEARTEMFLLFADGDKSGCIANPDASNIFHEDMPKRTLKSISLNLPSEWKSSVLHEKDASTSFPWDILYSKEEKERLYSNYSEAKDELLDRSEDSGSWEAFLRKKRGLEESLHAVHPKNIRMIEISRKIRETLMYWFCIETDERLAGVSARFLQVSIARRLMMAEPRLVSAYVKPGRAAPDICAIPAYGTEFVSLEFDRDAAELVLKTADLLKPEWGYSVRYIQGEMFGELPGFVLFEYQNDERWNDQFVYSVLNEMNERSIGYDILKREHRKSVVISKKSVKKAGMRSLVWDFSLNTLSLVLTVSEDTGKYIAGSRLEKLWIEHAKPFRIVRWLENGLDRKCGVCGSSLVFAAVSKGFVRSSICASCLDERTD